MPVQLQQRWTPLWQVPLEKVRSCLRTFISLLQNPLIFDLPKKCLGEKGYSSHFIPWFQMTLGCFLKSTSESKAKFFVGEFIEQYVPQALKAAEPKKRSPNRHVPQQLCWKRCLTFQCPYNKGGGILFNAYILVFGLKSKKETINSIQFTFIQHRFWTYRHPKMFCVEEKRMMMISNSY